MNVGNHFAPVKLKSGNIRAADAKEVGVGNPAEETCCYPNKRIIISPFDLSKPFLPNLSAITLTRVA